MKPDMIYPFSNGSAYGDWRAVNCDQCRYYRDDLSRSCRIDQHLVFAYCGEGLMPKSTALKAGWTEEGGMPLECKRRVETEERHRNRKIEKEKDKWKKWCHE